MELRESFPKKSPHTRAGFHRPAEIRERPRAGSRLGEKKGLFRGTPRFGGRAFGDRGGREQLEVRFRRESRSLCRGGVRGGRRRRLITTNRRRPPIAPVGLDYLVGAVRRAGEEVDLLDLGLAEDPRAAIEQYFSRHNPELIGLSFRNVDDCFWASSRWFVPELMEIIGWLRAASDAPLVLGGGGYSLFAAGLGGRRG